tara:strand:+ start:528 stop:842 length:315 start_codon:yes stop_codon:yes gene_type:complete
MTTTARKLQALEQDAANYRVVGAGHLNIGHLTLLQAVNYVSDIASHRADEVSWDLLNIVTGSGETYRNVAFYSAWTDRVTPAGHSNPNKASTPNERHLIAATQA